MKNLIPIFCCFLLCLFSSKSQAQSVLTQDSIELVDFGYALGGFSTPFGATNTVIGWNANLPTARQWRAGNPVSNWHGIDTIQQGTNYRVTIIDLSNIGNFTGGDSLVNNFQSPAPINLMDELQEINLRNGSLHGAFPFDGIFGTTAINLPKFKVLDISENDFDYSAAFFDDIIGNVYSLEVLRASACFNLATVIAFNGTINLNGSFYFNLKEIDLGKNGLGGQIPDFTQAPFTNLQKGIFDNNNLEGIINGGGSSNNNLRHIDISYNIFNNINNLFSTLTQHDSLGFFNARNTMNPIFGPSLIPILNLSGGIEKDIDLSENRLSGELNLNYFDSNSKTRSLTIEFNELDSVTPVAVANPFMVYLNLGNNQINDPLYLGLLSNYPSIVELFLNDNDFYGIMPEPIFPNTSYFTEFLEKFYIKNNPNLGGALHLDWLLDAQAVPAPIEIIKIADCDFEDVVMPQPNSFTNLQYVQVEKNRLHFDDLYAMVEGFDFIRQPIANSTAGAIDHYIPQFWGTNSLPTDTLFCFIYSPQDSAGIGGVRRRPATDSVYFATTVGEPTNFRKNDVRWERADFALTSFDTIVNVNTVAQGAGGATLTTSFGLNVVGAGALSQNPTQLMAIYNLDTIAHGNRLYYATVKHDSFPLLTIDVRPKKLIVGECYDSLMMPTLCQQIVVQYRTNISDSSKLELRKEFGIDVIDSCVCGAIELWSMPDTLNQVEVEQFGTGTRSSAGRASTKAELLSADQNYPLLGGTAASTGQAPSFTQGSSNTNPTLIAIVDSGVDFDNPKIKDRIWVKPSEAVPNGLDDDSDCEVDNGWGWNYLGRDNNSSDDHGHGTAVASVVAGYSSVNIVPNLTSNDALAIVPYKYTNAAGQGTVFHAACALRHAADYRDPLTGGQEARVRVINTSWGYYGAPCIVLENAILYAGDQCDVLIVTSAGNDALNTSDPNNTDTRHWPSNSPFASAAQGPFVDNVISVAALGANPDMLATYSNWSPMHIDIAAAGTTDTYVLGADTTVTATKNGTSFAAPQVARVAGLLFDEFPNATAGAVKNALLLGVDVLQSADSAKIVSRGRLNYNKARQILMNTLNPTLCASNGFVVSVDNLENIDNKMLAKVYPNPMQTFLRIDFDGTQLNLQKEIRVQLISVDGKMIQQHQINNQPTFEFEVDNLPAGFYLLHIEQGFQRQIQKVIKF